MKSIPLTRSRHAGNFVIALEQSGMPVEHYLSRANPPVTLLEDTVGDGIISAISMLEFAEGAAMDCGILDLGFHAGLVPVSDYGEFGYDGPASEAPYGGCTTACELGPYCGDGIVQEHESCDDGDPNAPLHCSACRAYLTP